MTITDINNKIEELQEVLNSCFNEDGEMINESKFKFTEDEIYELKKKQNELVNKNSLLKIDTKEFSISQDKINSLKLPFLPMADKYFEYIGDIETIKAIKEEDYTTEICAKAKRLKLDIAKIRTATGKIKDSEKEVVKQIGGVTQKCHNVIVKIVEEQEEILERISNYFEEKEKERVRKLTAERIELLQPFEVENLLSLKVGEMEESIFNNFLQGCKTAFEQKKIAEAKRIEDERIAEEKRIEEIKKQAVAEYKEKEVIKEVVKEVKLENTDEIEKKRLEFAKYRDSIEYDKYEKEDGKIIFYKKVGEFII